MARTTSRIDIVGSLGAWMHSTFRHAARAAGAGWSEVRSTCEGGDGRRHGRTSVRCAADAVLGWPGHCNLRGPWAADCVGERMIVSIALYWVVATLLTACWLWAVPKLFGIAVPVVDALIIAALCTAIAPLPRAGWVLATIIMALLIIRTTDANGWRETTLMVVGSSVIWLLLMAMFLS